MRTQTYSLIMVAEGPGALGAIFVMATRIGGNDYNSATYQEIKNPH
jgi:hypothetical protein